MQNPIVSISTIRNFMGNAGRHTCNEYLYRALLDADEALQMQIAKDVIKSNSASTKTYLCPVCKRTTIKDNNYCGNCGQQLNTSKIERKKLMRLKFKGYSDDTFGEYGIAGEVIDNCRTIKSTSVYCRWRRMRTVDGNWPVLKGILWKWLLDNWYFKSRRGRCASGLENLSFTGGHGIFSSVGIGITRWSGSNINLV